MKNFAKKMRECRINLDITQAELAKMAHLSPAAISAYENGGKSPTLDNAIAIADVLGMSLDDLRDSIPHCITYADVFEAMILFIKSLKAEIYDEDSGGIALMFRDATTKEILSNIRTIKKCFGTSEAEKELYKLWHDKKAEEYSQLEVKE